MMPIYYGADKILDLYFGNIKIKEVYYGSMLVYGSIPLWEDLLYTEPGEFTATLPAATYVIVCRGAGGASGAKGYQPQYTSGNGGAGAKGDLTYTEITIEKNTEITVYIGDAGRAGTNGNGGKGGGNGGRETTGADGGLTNYCGGGGGKPSYVAVGGSAIAYANGGGGGGAGGNTNAYGRYSGGTGGAGGGGYYRFHPDTLEIENVPGKNGAGGVRASDSRIEPRPSVPGNLDFNVYSGNSANGAVGLGAIGALGGGASSGSGGHGRSNDNVSGSSSGGGAGGSLDAGGGQGGSGGVGGKSEDGYNHHTAPSDTFSDNARYGVWGFYGVGGAGGSGSGQNGTSGFVLIMSLRQNIDSKTDLGLVNEEAEDAIDCAGLIKLPDYYNDYGLISGGQVRRMLPQGYQEVAYLESTGAQYIDTGVIPNPNTGVELIAESLENTSATRYLFGVENNSARYLISVGASTGTYMFASGNPNSNRIVSSVNPYTNPRRHVHRIVNGKYYIDDSLQGKLTIATLQNAPSAWIFAASNATAVPAGNRSKWRVYACTLTQSGEPVRDFVPVMRESDKVLGMFDVIEQKFYANAGTGNFISGVFVHDYGTLGQTQEQKDFGKIVEFDEVDEIINNGAIYE